MPSWEGRPISNSPDGLPDSAAKARTYDVYIYIYIRIERERERDVCMYIYIYAAESKCIPLTCLYDIIWPKELKAGKTAGGFKKKDLH